MANSISDDKLDYLLQQIDKNNDIHSSFQSELKKELAVLTKDIKEIQDTLDERFETQHREIQHIKDSVKDLDQRLQMQERKIAFLDDRDKDRRYHLPSQHAQAAYSSYTQTGDGFSSSRRKADHPFDR